MNRTAIRLLADVLNRIEVSTRILMGLLALCLASCAKTEYGPELTEPGTVAQVCYVPEGHGSGSGISAKGTPVFVSTHIPARYAIVFNCQHGNFAVDVGKAEWSRATEGAHGTIYYREVFKVKDGARRLADLDFVRFIPERGQ